MYRKARVLLLGVILAASSITAAHVSATYDRGQVGRRAAAVDTSSYPWSLNSPEASVAVVESDLFPGYPESSRAAAAGTGGDDARLRHVGLGAPQLRVPLFGRPGRSAHFAP